MMSEVSAIPTRTHAQRVAEAEIITASAQADIRRAFELRDQEIDALRLRVEREAAEVRRLTAIRALTHEQAVQACANVGVDLTCGACAAVFYTGVGSPHDVHTCAGRDEIVEALADAHTDGREPGVSTTVPDETIEAARRALDNCGEESRMVHRDHLASALAEVRRLTATLAAADARLREMGSREEELEAEIERLAAVEAEGESAVQAARLDGARAMREAAAVSLESAVWTTDTRFSRVQAEEVAAIRALDPAAVVGSGS